jgi:hypothetical protein
MKPHTERLQREFEEVVRRGNELAARLDEAALRKRPAENSWSVAECLDHLSATAEMHVRRFRRTLDEATVRNGSTEEKLTWRGRLFVHIMEPPVGRIRLPLPTAKLAPVRMESREALMERFADMHDQLLALLIESDALDRNRLRVTTPASKRITITLVDGFSLLAAHARRHLWQAERAAR